MSSNAYAREDGGSLVAVPMMCLSDDPGRVNLGPRYNPCALTHSGATTLKGWGEDDGEADVYLTEAGREVIVPARVRDRVREQLAAK